MLYMLIYRYIINYTYSDKCKQASIPATARAASGIQKT